MTTARPSSSEQFFREVTSVPQAQQQPAAFDFDEWGSQSAAPSAPSRPAAPSRGSAERSTTTTTQSPRFEEPAEYDETGAGADEFEYEDFDEGNV